MAKTFIDIAGRWKSALGYGKAVPFLTPEPMPINQISLYGDAKAYSAGDMTFEDILLENKEANINLHFGAKMITKSGALGEIFAPPPMVAWRKVKNLIITPIDGTDGEVVERYGDNAWDIRMQGLLVDMENHEFPLGRLEQLRKMFETSDHFKIASDIFNALGIANVYFYDIDIAGIAGFKDTVTYNLGARSIKPIEFFLNGE